MCGRYTLKVEPETLAAQMELDDVPALDPRYNIAPTQRAPVVRLSLEREARELELMRWGLVPFWAKDPGIGNRMINARSETVASKPAFRAAFKRRRCIVPADGFYEWRKTPDGKQPYRIMVDDGAPFAMAGLWESWRPKDTDKDKDKDKDAAGDVESLHTFTILTTAPNDKIARLHDRMPVILAAEEIDRWLDPGVEGGEALTSLMDAFPAARMSAYPVSTHVNRPGNDDPSCIEPIGPRLEDEPA